MQITTQIQTSDPNYPYSPEQAAAQVLAALGGSAATGDSSAATVQQFRSLFVVSVTLADDDNLAYNADQAATQALAALAGDPTRDRCVVSVTMPLATGEAGTA